MADLEFKTFVANTYGIFDPTDYGADPTGTIDSTAAFRSMFAAIETKGGGRVSSAMGSKFYIGTKDIVMNCPTSTLTRTASVKLPNVPLILDFRGITFYNKDLYSKYTDFGAIFYNYSYTSNTPMKEVIILGGEYIGNKSKYASNSEGLNGWFQFFGYGTRFYLDSCKGTTTAGNLFLYHGRNTATPIPSNVADYGIGGAIVEVHNCDCRFGASNYGDYYWPTETDYVGAGIDQNYDAYYLWVYGAVKVITKNCYFDHSYCDAQCYYDCKRVIYEGNHFHNTKMGSMFSRSSQFLVLKDNIVQLDQVGLSEYEKTYPRGSRGGDFDFNSEFITVTGNTWISTGRDSLWICGARRILVHHNQFLLAARKNALPLEGPASFSVKIDNTFYRRSASTIDMFNTDIVVDSNLFIGDDVTGGHVYISKNSNNVRVTNNTIYNIGSVVSLAGDTTSHYACIKPHTSSSTNAPVTGKDYRIYWQPIGWIPYTDYPITQWASGVGYVKGKTPTFGNIVDDGFNNIVNNNSIDGDICIRDNWEKGQISFFGRSIVKGTVAHGVGEFGRFVSEGTDAEAGGFIATNVSTTADYVIGSDGFLYVCHQTHTAASDKAPVTGTNWAQYWTLVSWSNNTLTDMILPKIFRPKDGNFLDSGDYVLGTDNKIYKTKSPGYQLKNIDWPLYEFTHIYWNDPIGHNTPITGEDWALTFDLAPTTYVIGALYQSGLPVTNQKLGYLSYAGYFPTNQSTKLLEGATIAAYASDNWTTVSAPTKLCFELIPPGSTSKTTICEMIYDSVAHNHFVIDLKGNTSIINSAA